MRDGPLSSCVWCSTRRNEHVPYFIGLECNRENGLPACEFQPARRTLVHFSRRKQGMQDFVKEPVLGLLKSVEDLAPEELMHGMARGAGSLLNHSVGGVANSVSLITGGKEFAERLDFSFDPTVFVLRFV